MKTNILLSVLLILLFTSASCSQSTYLKDHVLFYSSFDGKFIADVSVGDPMLYTAENYTKTNTAKPGLHNPDVVLEKNKGLYGDALHFTKANKSAIYYNASKNLGYSSTSWSGTVSFWLRVDPNEDLAPGYCDPICITDVRYNDAAFWVDFTDHNPRKFRLGALGDLAFWNPENKNDKILWEKRTVTVNRPSFESEKWTHVVMTYSEINTNNAVIKLYLNSEYMGQVKDVNDPFTWEEDKAKIMLGLGYIGLMDELSVFDKTFDYNEVKAIFELENGLRTWFN